MSACIIGMAYRITDMSLIVSTIKVILLSESEAFLACLTHTFTFL